MNLATILLAAVIAVAFLFAVRYCVKHGSRCSACSGCRGCSGQCAACSQAKAGKSPRHTRRKPSV